LSGSNSDNGQAGLSGVMLAVEQFNRAGGIDGRLIELISTDDAQDPHVASESAVKLVEAKVEAVIGPFTSSMATTVVPIFAKAGIFVISPTITAMQFYGQDDNLFRINRTTRDYARDYADVMVRRGDRRVAVAYDTRNRAFTESWLGEFETALGERGAAIAAKVAYESNDETLFEQTMKSMLASRPDSLLFLSGALDVARLAQQARKLAPDLPIAASEWAVTQHLLNYGGEVVEGLLIAQQFDPADDSPRFRQFTEAYFRRFQREPGYSTVAAYDAATVVLTALKNRRKGESVKAAALRSGPYEGLQQQIVFDENGDTDRKILFKVIRNNRYAPMN
jgi:branched-chain amino acid transport system substrate-binding protein